MVTITYDTLKSVVTSDKTSEQKHVYDMLAHRLSFFKDGYWFSPQYQMGVWDGKQQFFFPKTGKLYSGYITRALQFLHRDGIEYNLVGYPEPLVDLSAITELRVGDIDLYPHQVHAVKQAIKFSRGVVKVATNGGKTEIAAAILNLLNRPPAVFYVPRATLVKQVADRLEKRLGCDIGMIGAGFNKVIPKGINVAMTHTSAARLKAKDAAYVTDSQVMIADECHLSSDPRYQLAIEKCPANIRVLMSGTPYKGDPVVRAYVQAYGGPLLADVNNDELVEKGISAKPNVLYIEPHVGIVNKVVYGRMDYTSALKDCLERNQTIAALTRAFVAEGIQTLVLVTKTEHGQRIQEHVSEATFTHGSASNRKATEQRLRDGEVFGCIATAIFDTGLDVPNIGAILYAGGGPNEVRLAQSLGRLLRQNETRDKQPWFVDFLDTYHPVLKRHSRARMKYFKQHKTFTLTDDFALLPSGVYSRFMQEIARMGGL